MPCMNRSPLDRNGAYKLPVKPWMDVTIRAALIGAGVMVYLDLKAEVRSVRVDLNDRIERVNDRIERVNDRIERVEAKLDRVETKVDEVRGYLKFDLATPNDNPAPGDRSQ